MNLSAAQRENRNNAAHQGKQTAVADQTAAQEQSHSRFSRRGYKPAAYAMPDGGDPQEKSGVLAVKAGVARKALHPFNLVFYAGQARERASGAGEKRNAPLIAAAVASSSARRG